MKSLILPVLLCGFLSACAALKPAPPPTQTPTTTQPPLPTPTATSTPRPTATRVLPDTDTGWRPLRTGLEKREIDIIVNKRQVDHLFLLRIDPACFRFEVAYDAEHPHSIQDWQKQTGALVVFNGGFFKVEKQRYLPAGLLVVDGQTFGESYTGFGGMFGVSSRGPDLRSLAQQPYQPGEPLQYALQSFPVLVKPGGLLGFPAQYEDNMLARRTVIGRDRDGRFIAIVADSSYFTLYRLSVYLVDSDLNLDVALNLDGGPSSGIALAAPYMLVPATSFLPIVITVFPR